ncbi:MDR family MFS transporter [Paenibacillus chartarius]|uniref:MDR family MFS transporter n=1 Tax=Paenibacillus chartarius TaxID=747481 RepID=A0ABV6DRD0_9BACL
MLHKMSGVYRTCDTAIWIRVVGTALTSVTNFMLRPFLVLYLHERMDGSILLPMMIVGLPPLCGMLMSIYGGTLSDKYGRKPVMLASLWIQAVCMLGYLLADEVWQYALVASCIGLGNAMFMPAANAQVADVVPLQNRAKVFALLHTALNVGAAAGPLLGLLMFAWRPELVFVICAASTLLYSVLVWLKVPETRPPGGTGEAGDGDLKEGADGSGKRVSAERLPWIRGVVQGWQEHRALYLITLCALVLNMLYAQVETTLPLHLQKNHPDNYQAMFAAMLTFNGLAVIVLQMWIASRSEHLPSCAVIGAAYLLYALVALGYGFAPWFWLLLVVEFVFTIGEMLQGPHIQKVISTMAPADKRGWYFSIFSLNWQLARAVGPVLGGLLMNAVGGEAMFSLLGLLIAGAGFGMVAVVRKATSVHVKLTSVHARKDTVSVTVEG